VSNTKIKTFAKQTLGCQCPEEVFDVIDCQRDIELSNQILLTNKINIGNRLLIYIVETDDINFIKNNLQIIFQFGIKERDSKAFNRVRFVIATNKFEEIKLIAENIFKNLTDKDDKIHLHLISKNEFTQF
jgi:hypothetical protein